jgi:DNA-binding transcriptional ArsR family regulator
MTAEERARVFKALGDPCRVDIVDLLARDGKMSGTVIADALGISPSLLCHHSEVLLEAGILKKQRVGQLRSGSAGPTGSGKPPGVEGSVASGRAEIRVFREAAGCLWLTVSATAPAGRCPFSADRCLTEESCNEWRKGRKLGLREAVSRARSRRWNSSSARWATSRTSRGRFSGTR